MNEILGVDVSHYQGVMNWDLAKSRGVQFAIIKAGEGTSWRDPQFDRNVSECRRLGIKWGAYFYFYPQFDTMGQANNFINILMGHAPDIEIWGDFEQKTGVIDITAVQARSQTFMNYIDDFYRAGIYTSPDYAKSFLMNADWMKRYPLWIANYFVATPTIPPPWDAPTFWQFTSTYHGYGEDATATAIDANYWMGSADEWKTFAGVVTPPVIVEPPVIEPPVVVGPTFTAEDKAKLDKWSAWMVDHVKGF